MVFEKNCIGRVHSLRIGKEIQRKERAREHGGVHSYQDMAESFEIRSKSFTIKWVNIPSDSLVKWTIKPLKNSINLGIYQQNQNVSPPLSGSSVGSNNAHHVSSSSVLENLDVDEVNQIPHRLFTQLPSTSSIQTSNASILPKSNSPQLKQQPSMNTSANVANSPTSSNSLEGKLDQQLIKRKWIGRCSGDSVRSSTFEIRNAGLYAFVFDNTFSKTKAKTVLFKYEISSLNERAKATASTAPTCPNNAKNVFAVHNKVSSEKFGISPGPDNNNSTRIINIKGSQYLEGFLMKKRRRKGGKNFIKRFFSLNLTYAVLDYYSNDKSNKIRGNMMVTQAVISADSSELMMYLDSGMEQWVLKATSLDNFKTWVNAFNFIKNKNKILKEHNRFLPQKTASTIDDVLSNKSPISDFDSDYDDEYTFDDDRSHRHAAKPNPQFKIIEEKITSLKSYLLELSEKEEVDSTVLSNPKNKVTNRYKTGPINFKKETKQLTSDVSNGSQATTLTRKPSFLQRLKSRNSQSTPSTPEKQSFDFDKTRHSNNISYDDGNNGNGNASCVSSFVSSSSSQCNGPLNSVLFKNEYKCALDTILERVTELEIAYQELVEHELCKSSRAKASLSRSTSHARSIFSQEFYDAQEYVDKTKLGVMMLDQDLDDVNHNDEVLSSKLSSNTFEQALKRISYVDDEDENSSTSLSDGEEEEETQSSEGTSEDMDNSKTDHIITLKDEESLEHDLYPLPYNGEFHPRMDIKPAAAEPPSLISILRKGVGKDLTNMSMPITTNEPLSFLQTYAENFEYCGLINDAINSPIENGERILKIATFAITFLSSYKDKVRSIRKPFNPLLGETFELVRPDLDIRLITEKVIHKPFIMAAHVDSKKWYISQSICPQQKFYGKTAELSVDGTLKLMFRDSDESYEWNQPNTILRNIVSLTGEKYHEPVDSITIKSNTGLKCVVSFISENGRFTSGRSEKVELKVYSDKKGQKPLPLTAHGSWTESIKFNNGKQIWHIHDQLKHHEKKYGFTKFACNLNYIDEPHVNCAPTDSRRRPDQKLYEDGKVDQAGHLKLKLEEDQRLRRKDSAGNDVVHCPAFFVKGHGDLDWSLKRGKDSYWNRRKTSNWEDLVKLW